MSSGSDVGTMLQDMMHTMHLHGYDNEVGDITTAITVTLPDKKTAHVSRIIVNQFFDGDDAAARKWFEHVYPPAQHIQGYYARTTKHPVWMLRVLFRGCKSMIQSHRTSSTEGADMILNHNPTDCLINEIARLRKENTSALDEEIKSRITMIRELDDEIAKKVAALRAVMQ